MQTVEELQQKLNEQIAITDSLKKDLAALQAKTVVPCPNGQCSNQHTCWEPCGVMGNDERFVKVSPIQDIPVLNDKVE